MPSIFENQFRSSASKLTGDLRHRSLIQKSLKGYEKSRDEKQARFQDWEAARLAAAETKWEAINHPDKYLCEFADNLTRHGPKNFCARTACAAHKYIVH